MLLGKVVGTVVASVVYEGLETWPMLLVQPLDKRRRADGSLIVCADSTRMAGRGELVYYEGGREAALALEPWFVPVDHTIVGIVDQLSIDGELVDEPAPKKPAAKKAAASKTAAAKRAAAPKKAASKKAASKKQGSAKKATKRGGRK